MSSKNKNEKEKKNGNENENDETLMPLKDDNDNENKNDKTLMTSKDDENENKDDDNDDETMSQNKIIKGKNDLLDEIIDKSKSFEEQIKSLKKREDLKGFWPYNDYGDKELKSKYFKIELAGMSNDIDKKLFEQIFGHILETLANKLINTKSTEENQITFKILTKIKINFKKQMIFIIM